MSAEVGTKKKKITSSIIIGLLILVIILLVTITILFAKKGGEKSQSKPKRDILVTEENVDKVIKNLELEAEANKVLPGTYEVCMTNEWVFETASSEAENMYVENSNANTNDVYFDLILKDTEEIVYSSPVIPIGKSMSKLKLDKELEPGTYNAIVNYHLLDKEQNELSTLAMNIVFTIRK